MKAIELYDYFKEISPSWVNWSRTCDQILYGDPNIEVNGIAVGWMSTWKNLKKAVELGCNVFVCHEPLYLGIANSFGVYMGGSVKDTEDKTLSGLLLEEDDVWVKKEEWLREQDLVIMRCHDTWDDYPDIGIHGAWAKWLGFEGEPIEFQRYYEVHDVSGNTLEDILKMVSGKLKDLGQDCIHYIGDLNQKVSKMAFGTGAITDYRLMVNMGADLLVLTDDGTRLWESAQFSEDSEIPVIIVNHATAEEPGIRKLADLIQQKFKNIPVKAIERGCLYKTYS